ncbi:hypothetical protein GGX14DRAFT_694995 [Mycena pura]|uniref:Tetraspanin n=1 Tax=Mycena pura TaxID=153505 RepID=A0AAD6YKK3_9AGAR|nr:hypothetical protein GGX14DRAFT_694995 [Mycena pura]
MLSLRWGLVAIATLGLFSGLTLSIMGLIVASRLNGQLTDVQSLAVSFHVIVYVLLALFSMVGLYGTAYERRTAVQVFVSMLIVQLVFGVASGFFVLCTLFQKQSADTVQTCIAQTNAHDSFGRQLCERSSALKGVSVALLVVVCFIEIGGLVIGISYSSRLAASNVEQKPANDVTP